VPAESKAHIVRVSGIAKQSGTITIDGIVVRMLGGAIEETIRQVTDTKKKVESQSAYLRKPLEFLKPEPTAEVKSTEK
jgi:citrate lyase gamma subunit